MPALAVIEHFNVRKYCRLRLVMCVKVLQRNACGFSGRKAALRHGILPAVALAAHTRQSLVLGEDLPIAVRPLLPAPSGRQDQPRCRAPLAECPRQRLIHECRPPVIGPGPPDHRPRAQSKHHSEGQPACTGWQGGNGPHVHGSRCWHCTLPVKLSRGHGLGLTSGRRRCEFPPGFAAQTRLGQEAPKATPADVQALLRQQVFAPACALGPTALGTILLDFRFPLWRGVGEGAGGPAEPRIVATPRPLQAPT
jgi:hypothetical protein